MSNIKILLLIKLEALKELGYERSAVLGVQGRVSCRLEDMKQVGSQIN